MKKFFAIGMVLVTIIAGAIGFSAKRNNDAEPILTDEEIIEIYVDQEFGEEYQVELYDLTPETSDDEWKTFFLRNENGEVDYCVGITVKYAESEINRNS